MNKRVFTVVIVCILIVTILAGCESNTAGNVNASVGKVEESKEIALESKAMTFDAAVDDEERIYTADTAGIHILDKEGKKVKDMPLEGNLVGALCLDGKNIYAYNQEKNEILSINESGQITDRKSFSIKVDMVYKMRKQGGRLYLLAAASMNEKVFLSYDLASGQMEKLDIKDVMAFSCYKGTEILVATRTDGKNNLSAYNDKDGKLRTLVEFETSIENMEYDASGNQLFFTDYENLYKMDGLKWKLMFAGSFPDKSPQSNFGIQTDGVVGIPDNGEVGNDMNEKQFYFMFKGHNIMLAGNHIFTFNGSSGPMIRFSKATDPEHKVMKILNNANAPSDDRMVKQNFRKKNGGVSVVSSTPNKDEYYAKLSVLLLSGDDSIDMFSLDAAKAADYYKKGLFSDLSAYPALKEKFGRMIPSIAKGCSQNGKIVGAPNWLNIPVFNYDKELVEAMKVTVDEKMGWKELLELAKKVGKDTNGDGKADIQAFSASWSNLQKWLFDQYAVNQKSEDGKISYDTQEFKSVLDILKELKDGELVKEVAVNTELASGTVVMMATNISSGEKADSSNMFSLSSIQDVFITKMVGMMGRGSNALALPKLNNSAAIRPYEMGVLVLNPKSKNKELAAEYMDIMLTPSTYLPEEQTKQKKVDTAGGKDGSSTISISYMDILEVSRVLYNDISLYGDMDSEWLKKFVGIMESSKISSVADVFEESQEILKQFYSGSIDTAKAAAMIDNKAKKMKE